MGRLLLATVALAAALSAKPYTLEQVLSAPFPSEMIAAPTGDKVAWLLNERGARNIWFAGAPDFKGVQLTAYKGDSGLEIGQMHWTPDGRSIVYVRGGDLEFLGRADPNPTADPAGAEQAIWIIAPGGQPRKLAEGHSPAVSPKGDRVVFLRGGQIWTMTLDGAEKPSQLIRARAGVMAEELTWSPDGAKLAFVSARANHSFIAVYDFAAKAVLYMDPSVDHDALPAWSPDSRQIAFVRDISPTIIRGARREDHPWGIRVASVADGAGRQIWRAEKGPGSVFRGIVSESQLLWAAGNRIVFPWERDGWNHLYSVAVEGGPATLLTPGNFEVEHVSFSGDGKEIVYSSNQDDINRRHIWRVSTAGGSPRAVTKGETLEWSPVLVGSHVAFLRADARKPARVAIQTGSAAPRDLAPDAIPADFPADSLVVPQPVLYSASDGMQIHGQLFLPPDSRPGQRHPALVFIHGGSRRQMLLGWHHMEYYNKAYAMNQYFASQGYIVLSINYRSGIGYGLNFREALNFGITGASEYHDVEGAGLYLRGRNDVDPAHIGVWGGSYGGYLAAMALARGSDMFSAGVDFHGVHDWSSRFRVAAAAAVDPDVVRTAFESSPVAAIRTWKSPVLLIHGDDDRNVDFSQTLELVTALRREDVYFEQLILPDEIHSFLRHGSWLRAYQASVDFFRRKL